VKDDVVGLSDFVWQRTWARLQGLTDEEYFWQAVPGCWTIRDRGDGVFVADGVQPAPVPAPFTTVAWRIAHLTGCYGADRNGRFLRVDLAPPVLDPSGARRPTAAEALDLLDRAHIRWRRHLTAAEQGVLADKLGPIAGHYADGTVASFVLHMIDEFIHHGAELALLRDLFTATKAGAGVSTGNPVVDAAIRDPATLDTTHPTADGHHTDAVQAAASAGRWDVVVALAGQGFDVNAGDPRTALHLAAGAGANALHALPVLVEHGADPAAREPVWNSTPLGWAQYFGNARAAAYLGPLTPDE
jgi:hypothetical protein